MKLRKIAETYFKIKIPGEVLIVLSQKEFKKMRMISRTSQLNFIKIKG